MEHPINILERYWNFTSFKPLQEDIIQAAIAGEDTFALLPTGGGKSICFQIPALAQEGMCIVISPLIALMNDQVSALKEKGIKAVALTSNYKPEEISILLDNCIYGKYKFLYLSPERLQNDVVQERIRHMNINLIAVDEAHCISQWGNDFRPAYKNIVQLRRLLPTVNCLALTASATPEVVSDIMSELDFIQPKIFKQSFNRSNLAYMVFETEDKHYRIEQILSKNPEASIIYVRNRKSTIQISQYLESKGFGSTFYHGGLTSKEKDQNFSAWKNNQKQVMVATNAFGMGIDKADVKTVIHVNLPESIESYFQEAGRAGRNGQKAYAVMLKNKGDASIAMQQFVNILPSVDFVKQLYRRLCNYFQISYGEGDMSTHDLNFAKFCKTYQFNTMIAYNAFQILDRSGVISLSQQFQKRSTVQIVVANNVLFQYMDQHPESQKILKSILRTYGGIFDHKTKINTTLVADKADTTEAHVIDVLTAYEKAEITSLKLKTTDAQITFLQPREDDKTINRIASMIEQQNRLKEKQLESVLQYINNDDVCKAVQLLTYFGEKDTEPCGICSVCIQDVDSNSTSKKRGVIEHILVLLSEEPLSSRAILKHLTISETELNKIIIMMLENNQIEITPFNTYKLK